ncbi:MAG: VCBS repeat-containing protein [Akkermansiaceae bacterium]|nr:VCBS repeat-containing protein [Akkermansiaceae bacterium]
MPHHHRTSHLPLRGVRRLIALALLVALVPSARALVNPAMQPSHMWAAYRNVLIGQIGAVAADGSRAELRIDKVCKGGFPPKAITLNATDAAGKDAVGRLCEGDTFVAWAGKSSRRSGEFAFSLYSGVRSRWQEGVTSADGAVWTCSGLVGGTDESDGFKTLHGTWNGHSTQLARLMQDMGRKVDFFPALPFDRWGGERGLAKFDDAITAVALADTDGDGRLDVLAATASSVKALRQQDDGKFADVTEAWGLTGQTGARSLSVAAWGDDLRPALLLDARLLRWNGKQYAQAEMLPAAAGENLVNATFLDANHDGRADVLVSQLGGGLRLWHNDGTVLTDVTSAVGLDCKENGAGGSGKVCWGDWRGDGSAALFYATGKGLLLVPDAQGVLAGVPLGTACDFSVDGIDDTARTGGGVFAPLAQDNRCDLAVARESGGYLFSKRQGRVKEVTGEGNELADGGFRLTAALAEDMNADGRCDLMMLSGSDAQPNWIATNRGYGSWMRVDKVDRKAYQAPGFQTGAGAAAAGDVDGDGANDLLLGGVDGVLRLEMNGTLETRRAEEGSILQQQALARTVVLAVAMPATPGALGATLTLTDATGIVVAVRRAGAGATVGSAGPLGVNIAVREPGAYILKVRWTDQVEKQFNLNLGGQMPHTLTVLR